MSKLRARPLSVFLLLALVAFIAAGQARTWYANGAPVCQVQITGIDHSATVQANQILLISTHLTITCNSENRYVVARIDVIANETGAIITSNSTGLGVVQLNNPPYIKTVNVTISNAVRAPSAAVNWKLQIRAWLFTGPSVTANVSQYIQVQVVKPQVTSTTSTKSIQVSTATSSTSANLGVVDTVGLVAALAVLASLVILVRRRKQKSATAKPAGGPQVEQLKPAKAVSVAATKDNFSTGYLELDRLLGGGIPYGYAVLLVSPPCDERDLLLRKIIESSLSLGNLVFYMTSDSGQSQDLAKKYTSNFYAITTSADSIAPTSHNISRIPSVPNLNDLNMSFSNALDATPNPSKRKILIIDLLSDVLLEHEALTTYTWLDEFIARRKSEGFTILATLNPLTSSPQESQTIIALFDGIIDIYEKKLRERSRRFLAVKKMYKRKYMETELMLDKDKLF